MLLITIVERDLLIEEKNLPLPPEPGGGR